VDPYWTIISGVLSHGRGRAKSSSQGNVYPTTTPQPLLFNGRRLSVTNIQKLSRWFAAVLVGEATERLRRR
jgi:hypothetical protein